MELRQIRYFIEVAQRLNFSAAAEKLFVAQSAVSRQIAMLEEELGVALFRRTARSVELTAAGERFLVEAIETYASFEKLKSVDWNLVDEPSGNLAVGMPPSLLHALAAPVITDFRARYPKVNVRLEQGPTAMLRSELIDGRLDMAVISNLDKVGDLETSLLVLERVYLVGASRPPEWGSTLDPGLLVNYPQILTPNSLKMLAAKGLQDQVRIAAEVKTADLVLDLIEMGNGFSVLAGSAFAHRLPDYRVSAIEIDDMQIGWIVARRAVKEPGAGSRRLSQLFEDVLREGVGRVVDSNSLPSFIPVAD